MICFHGCVRLPWVAMPHAWMWPSRFRIPIHRGPRLGTGDSPSRPYERCDLFPLSANATFIAYGLLYLCNLRNLRIVSL